MHYIRLLRPPTVERHRGENVLKIAITITTDLSDAFLAPDVPVDLTIIGASQGHAPVPVNLTPSRIPKWQAGMRALKFDVPFPAKPVIKTIQIRPANRDIAALTTSDIYPGSSDQGLIFPVYADLLSSRDNKLHVCFRSLRLPQPDGTSTVNTLQVEEEMGESMARHIWDGGLTTVSLVANLCLSPDNSGKQKPLPLLSSILQQEGSLNILELGCGVGILGVGFARALALSPSAQKRGTHVLMTDLPDAQVRARANIERCVAQIGLSPSDKKTPVSLDFEDLDWNDGKEGIFGAKVQASTWDLVVLSDCTYNDLLPVLVQTLSALHHTCSERGADTKIMLATKPRHSAEREFFDLMRADGWKIAEQTAVRLPVLYSEDQTVEVYMFSKN
ncbi:putative methyltransferase-domain-containing protein [Rhypophila decipiens]|uniref:Methyltransferase-domain-containing protein n=1 Tax=Rhypophila decipiens TaxID=261697 RepID=A0AAN6YIM4_9PEZI|nr:putative methyltransferase-domain-containing protein [Rhypophila decipiens]